MCMHTHTGFLGRKINYPLTAIAKSSQDFHSRELNDYANFGEEDVKLISQQECISKLQELKDEINQSWCAGDRVMSLRLSIKVISCY